MPALLAELDLPLYAERLEMLGRLALKPPSALLLEGATPEVRLATGKYWTMLHNCPESLKRLMAGEPGEPCRQCSVCRQIAEEDWTDLRIFDGRISNRADEENPGAIRAMRMENMRELRAQLASRPRGDGKRTILLQGIGITREEAQNSLLKALEEPAPYNLFVLLVSQRQQILPTLVSRSFCLTLPWTGAHDNAPVEEGRELIAQLEEFLLSGKGFLDKIAQRGQLDAKIAAHLILELQKALVRSMASEKAERARPLDGLFAQLEPEGIAAATQWLAESQNMLEPGVSPARILEGLATRLFLLRRRFQGGRRGN